MIVTTSCRPAARPDRRRTAIAAESIPASLLEIRTHREAAFRPLVDFGAWRVAVLNFSEDQRPRNLTRLQRHDETDEVFVLLRGRCLLFVAEGREAVGAIHVADLEPLTVYNVKRGTWHAHALSGDASVLVVENRATTFDNSPFCALTAAQTADLVATAARLWPAGGDAASPAGS